MTKVAGAGVPLGVWLADLPDESLVRLLESRPDLTQPPPGTIAALAARAQARQSVKAATDALDFLHLAVLDTLLVLHADTAPVPRDMLVEYIGDRADSAQLKEALDALTERALVWGEDVLRVVAETAAGLPWYPGQALPDVPDLPAEQIPALLEGLDAPSRELLTRLVEGSPVGRTRDALPGTNGEVVSALGHHHLVRLKLLVEDDLSGDGALGPQSLRDVLLLDDDGGVLRLAEKRHSARGN